VIGSNTFSVKKLATYDIVGSPAFSNATFRRSDKYVFINDINIYRAMRIINAEKRGNELSINIMLNGEDLHDAEVIGSRNYMTYIIITTYDEKGNGTNNKLSVKKISHDIDMDDLGCETHIVNYDILSSIKIKKINDEYFEGLKTGLSRDMKLKKILK
jgi:hypothetical protein